MTRQKRRGNGQGTVFQRSSDGLWAAAFVDPITGKRRRTYAKSRAAANAKLREMISRADAGEVVNDARATLRAYVESWLEERAGKRRQPSTVGQYARSLDRYVLPHIGGIRIGELTVTQVEDTLDAMGEKGLSEYTIKMARNALSAVLTDAIRARHLRAGNVARMAQLPSTKRPAKVVPPTTEQVQALLEATEGTELGRIIQVLAATGARIGEVLAARWSSVDLETGVLAIEATASQDRNGRSIRNDRTKTGRVRVVALGARGAEALREQRRVVAERRLAAPYWEDEDLVFPSTTGSMIDPRNLRTQQFRPIAQEVGWPGSFHSLRHYVASVALAEYGGNEFLTSKVLGHSRIATTTDIYGHLLPEEAKGLASALDRRLGSAR